MGSRAYAYQPQLIVLIYGRRRDVLLREQKHHHGHQFFLVLASWVLGSAKFVRLQRQKPAMFAQMPLFVYRHFTGAACATSSDGRFALFSVPSTPAFLPASGLSNSSDMVRSRTSRSAVACSAHPIQNFLPGTKVAIVRVIWRMARPRAAPGTECGGCALRSRRLCCGRR